MHTQKQQFLTPGNRFSAVLAVLMLLTGCASPTVAPTATPTPPRATATTAPTVTVTPAPTATREPMSTFPPPPAKTPSPLTLSLKTYAGQGFSLRYPANARLENIAASSPVMTEMHIIGPQVWIKPGDADWVYRGPAYELIIRTYENPEGLDAESWTRNYILTSWQEARERDWPGGSFPVSAEGEIDEDEVGSRVVAGQPAFWVNYFAFDSYINAYYLTSNHQIVGLSFYDHPLGNQPLAMVQGDVYALLLDTFRLEGE